MGGITNSMNKSLSRLQEMVKDMEVQLLQSMGCKESDMTERLNNSDTHILCKNTMYVQHQVQGSSYNS